MSWISKPTERSRRVISSTLKLAHLKAIKKKTNFTKTAQKKRTWDGRNQILINSHCPCFALLLFNTLNVS